MERRDVVIIASVSAIYGLGDPESYMKMLLHLRVGDVVDQRFAHPGISKSGFRQG